MKILIIRLSALGDIVQAMVVLQFIKQINQNIIIDWVVEEQYKDLLNSNPDINQIHIVNIQKAKRKKSINLLFREFIKVRKIGKYDIVIDMQGLLKSALIAKIIPSKLKVGFDKKSIRESLASLFYNKKFKIDYSENIIIRNFSIAMNALDSSNNANNLFNKDPFLYSKDYYYLNLKSNNKKNILLVVGASFKSKCYPHEKLVELIKSLDANYFVIWGNENENLIAKKMQSQITSLKILEKLSIAQLISVIGQMDLVIGPDTGPTHFAWGLNIPSITLFGPTPASRNCFTSNINKFIESDTTVNPYKINKKDFSIKDIKVDDIVRISDKLLNIKT